MATADNNVGALGITGAAFTVTVIRAVALPPLFVAVNVYVVVAAGETDFDVLLETVPTPLSMLMLVAPEVLHDSVALCPAVITVGVAVKEVITGTATGGAGVVTCTLLLAGE